MSRLFPLVVFFISFSCSQLQQNSIADLESIEEKVSISDSLFLVKYYKASDSTQIDSIHRYELKFEIDSFVLTNEIIFQHDELLIEQSDSIRITLISPKYDWYALVLTEPFDSVFWGPNKSSYTTKGEPVTRRSMTIPNYQTRPIRGFMQDWGIVMTSDSLNSIGYQISRMLKFEISH